MIYASAFLLYLLATAGIYLQIDNSKDRWHSFKLALCWLPVLIWLALPDQEGSYDAEENYRD